MFCPRCGMQNTETTKFCRQCGLSLAQVTGFVAAGGTGSLAGSSPPISQPMPQPMLVPGQLPETSEMLALKQKRAMAIMAMVILPVVLTIIGEEMFNAGEVLAALFLLIPLGVVWASYRYKVDLRRLQEQQLQQFYAARQPVYAQPAQTPQPGFQAPSQAPQLPPPTNPFNLANPMHGSVIEDETRKLPIENQ